ncbi:SMP-30/gluconolaconase/LRE domain-containing protein [Flammeovirgaceae bacterium 311]|nr:SMP-30/gluconolaconase/LRE domain-containing protein [Flammeovirgaceae bacterium 311]
MKNALLLLWMLIFTFTAFAQKAGSLQKAFEVQENDLIPEGIAYDAKSGNFYVGSINKSKILRITPRGAVSDFVRSNAWGSWGYLGLEVDPEQQVLWACRYFPAASADSAGWGGLFKFDLASGKLIDRYLLPKTDVSHLFNDLLLYEKDVYITDSEAGAVLKLNHQTDSLEYVVPAGKLSYANGITASPNGKELIVATAAGLVAVNPASGDFAPVGTPGYYIIGVDGLYTYKGALIGMQSIFKPETICKYVLDASGNKITDIEVLASNQPYFEKITTGAIKDKWLYFIANSYVSELDEEGRIKDKSRLKNLVVYRLALE